jgi:uncharacterized membrane protein YdbT with pleckstrin-like domain
VAFPKRLLNDEEELILDLRPHWIFMFLPSTALGAAIVIGIVLFVLRSDDGAGKYLPVPGIILLVLALIWFVAKYVVWRNTVFVLTSDRILTRRGVFAKRGVEIPLERINTVFFNQRIFERIVGAGDLGIESAGERGTESFTNIRRPAVVQREIYVAMENNENRKFDRIGSHDGSDFSVGEELERLHALKEKGALSEAEYEAQKARLLSS